MCKNCKKERGATPEGRAAYLLTYTKARQHNPVKYLLYGARYRARKRGLPFDITEQDVETPDVCPVLGVVLDYWSRVGQCDKTPSNRASLDRLDPQKGYVKGNVRVVSYRANQLKSNMTLEECTLLLADLTRTAQHG